MATKQRGLGKGLGALIDDFSAAPASDTITKLPLQKVEPNPNQPRKSFDEEELQALADSIAEHGILQPLAVRTLDGGFILIYGGIEENCTIRALFDARRETLQDQVHGLLFA